MRYVSVCNRVYPGGTKQAHELDTSDPLHVQQITTCDEIFAYPQDTRCSIVFVETPGYPFTASLAYHSAFPLSIALRGMYSRTHDASIPPGKTTIDTSIRTPLMTTPQHNALDRTYPPTLVRRIDPTRLLDGTRFAYPVDLCCPLRGAIIADQNEIVCL